MTDDWIQDKHSQNIFVSHLFHISVTRLRDESLTVCRRRLRRTLNGFLCGFLSDKTVSIKPFGVFILSL